MSAGFSLEIIFVDGRREHHEFSGEQTTVGSSQEATLYLPLEELSAQHLLFIAREKGCWVSVARGVSTPVLLKGRILEGQEVPWGTELDVGTITLRIGEPVAVVQARKQGIRSLAWLGGVATAIVVVYALLQSSPQSVPRPPATAPELFNEAPPPCTVDRDEAFRRGKELEVAAPAVWQRYPFDAQDGIQAASLFGEASACFAAAGQNARAEEMLGERRDVIEQMNNDFQALRLQLTQSLKQEEIQQSTNQVARLANYIQHRPGEYLEWLARVDRYLRTRDDS